MASQGTSMCCLVLPVFLLTFLKLLINFRKLIGTHLSPRVQVVGCADAAVQWQPRIAAARAALGSVPQERAAAAVGAAPAHSAAAGGVARWVSAPCTFFSILQRPLHAPHDEGDRHDSTSCNGHCMLRTVRATDMTAHNATATACSAQWGRQHMTSLRAHHAAATVCKGTGEVFYGQEPLSWESTTTESGINSQLLAVIYWSSPMGLLQLLAGRLRCSRPQQATDNGVWLVAPPIGKLTGRTTHSHGQCSLNSTYCTVWKRPTNRKTCCSNRGSNTCPRACQTNARPVRPLRQHRPEFR